MKYEYIDRLDALLGMRSNLGISTICNLIFHHTDIPELFLIEEILNEYIGFQEVEFVEKIICADFTIFVFYY